MTSQLSGQRAMEMLQSLENPVNYTQDVFSWFCGKQAASKQIYGGTTRKVKCGVLTTSGRWGRGLHVTVKKTEKKGSYCTSANCQCLLLICRFKSDCKCQTWSTLGQLFQIIGRFCRTAIRAKAPREQGRDLKGSTANRFNVCTCVLALSGAR